MAFSPSLQRAAHRHLEAAEELSSGSRIDVAGYLYGIAAECAVKAMMIDAGIRPLEPSERRIDPFYLHFPELRTQLRDTLSGRRSSPLLKFIDSDRFMSNWSTMMRYSHGAEIQPQWVKNWAEQARQAVAAMGT